MVLGAGEVNSALSTGTAEKERNHVRADKEQEVSSFSPSSSLEAESFMNLKLPSWLHRLPFPTFFLCGCWVQTLAFVLEH